MATPNTWLNNTPDEQRHMETERRLDNLEIKASFMEDVLDELNLTVHQQQELIDRLVREVVQLRQQAPAADGGSGGLGASAVDERPPHY